MFIYKEHKRKVRMLLLLKLELQRPILKCHVANLIHETLFTSSK